MDDKYVINQVTTNDDGTVTISVDIVMPVQEFNETFARAQLGVLQNIKSALQTPEN